MIKFAFLFAIALAFAVIDLAVHNGPGGKCVVSNWVGEPCAAPTPPVPTRR